ncbi:SRPBCC domain-containing protein [Pedobacter agri]|uniref:SRPBCC domain-containing protein n=1 Tax=Pedobacter agri TaxID=454586 RepID=UPI00292D4E09|nr:SRPBCC domain-containing protein [Pedobacter agri]
MEKIEFKTEINANAEKVWNTLFGKETYPKWTAAFAENSSLETTWLKGSKAIFGDGTGNGMFAIIEENIPNKFMSIKHLGEVKDGKEELKDWGEPLENYSLSEENGITELNINMDITEDWKGYFEEAWPKALTKVKALAEGTEKNHI